METLVSDCLPPIFSYLSLADLLHLRSVSRRFEQEVEGYLPKVRSLPLYLTTPRTPEEIARYESMCLSHKEYKTEVNNGIDTSDRLSNDFCFRRLSFGTSGYETFEDLTILQNQKHFRRSDFLILNHSSALFKFFRFIQKLCPNIEKLALVIDHCDHYLPEVSKVLKAFPAIKVLLVERTIQDVCRNKTHLDTNIDDLLRRAKNSLKLPPVVYDSIAALKHLEELYFFSKRQCQLSMEFPTGSRQYRFMKILLGRLRVLHFNTKSFVRLPVDCESEESIEELAGPLDSWCLSSEIRPLFPKLRKFIQFGEIWWLTAEYDSLSRSLKVFDISNDFHYIHPKFTDNLNSFTGLERFHCGRISFPPNQIENANEQVFDERYVELEIVPENLKNRTIKYLQVISGPETAEKRIREVRRWSKYFVALETCTFLEPEYSVVRVSDL